MKKLFTFLSVLLLVFTVTSCTPNNNSNNNNDNNPNNGENENGGNTGNNNGNENNENQKVNVLETPVVESQNDGIVTDTGITDKLENVYIEVGETYNISSLLSEFSGMTASIKDGNVASINKGVITGSEVGVTKLILSYDGHEQVVRLKVFEKGALGGTFTFDKYRLSGKNIVAFGDSVTDYATNNQDGYYELFAKHFGMNAVKNYAIGGTTAHYGYEGTNLYNEYFDKSAGKWIMDGQIEDGKKRSVVDGPQRVTNAYNKTHSFDKLDEVDYVFIAYTHNDQYFQPVLTHDGYDEYEFGNFESCKSFKGSYAYMIKTLRKANPDVRIILMAPTYAEYNLSGISYYGKETDYADFRKVIKEVAEEYNVKYVNSWNHLKDYYDFDIVKWTGNHQYYKDAVHMNANGMKQLTNYLADGMTDWHLYGEFTDSWNDIDWQFSKISDNKLRLNATFDKDQLGKQFVLTNGHTIIDGSKLSNKDSSVAVVDFNNMVINKPGEYVIEIDLDKGEASISYARAPYIIVATRIGTGTTYLKRYSLDANSKCNFNVPLSSGEVVQIAYSGRVISSKDTKISGSFENSDISLYRYSSLNTLFACKAMDGASYTFSYDGIKDTLEVSATAAEQDTSGLVYSGLTGGAQYKKTAKANSDGSYTFSVTLARWGSLLVKYNGLTVHLGNTNISGDYVGESSAPGTKELYHDAGSPVFYSSYNGSATYTLKYTPAKENQKATLTIVSDNSSNIPSKGFYVETLYNNTESQDVVGSVVSGDSLTVKFVKRWGYIRFYYDGELLTTANTTFKNIGDYNQACSNKTLLYMDSNDAQFKTAQLNYGYVESDGKTTPPSTFTFTYDPVAKTLTVTYVA